MLSQKAKPRSVLFVTTSYPRFEGDFAGTFVYRFAKCIVSKGLKVSVLAPGAPNTKKCDQVSGVNAYRFNYFWPTRFQSLCYEGGGILANLRTSLLAVVQLPFFIFRMPMALKSMVRNIDIVHCHWLPTVWAALIVRAISVKKFPIVFTNWGSDTRLFPKTVIRWTLSKVDGCVSTAVETDQHLIDAGILQFAKIMAPIDEDKFNKNISGEKIRAELKLDMSIPLVVFIGRLNYFKDPLTFIYACKLLKEKTKRFRALIVGDGDMANKCRELIQRLEVEDVVLMLGVRSDTEEILAAATVSVHISPIENTWANVIAESMFMGRPVIMTDVGHTKSTFNDNQNCLLVPAKNPEALAGKIKELFENAELRSDLVKGANQLLIDKKKDSISIANQICDFYEKVILDFNQ